jgi:hypothetical protein
MNWKQPIPTKVEGLNPFETLVFQAILLRCSNSKTQVKVADDNTYIELERGQCIIGRFEFAKQFGFSKSESLRVYRIVKKLEKVNNLLNNQKSKNCSILTVLNYDDWVSFEQSNEQTVNNQRTNREQTVNTNKSDKSVKTAKSDYSFDDFWELYRKKGNKKTSKSLWSDISEKQRAAIFGHVPRYQATRDFNFCLDAERYLKRQVWEDEVFDNRKKLAPETQEETSYMTLKDGSVIPYDPNHPEILATMPTDTEEDWYNSNEK